MFTPRNDFISRIRRVSNRIVTRYRARHATRVLMQYNADIIRRPQAIARNKFTIYPEHRIFFDRIGKNANQYVVLTLEEAVKQKPVEVGAQVVKQTTKQLIAFSAADARELRTYYSFCVSRNPYTRALSGFLDKIGKGKDVTFARFPGFGDNTAQGFTAFLRSLSLGGELYCNAHFWPQTEAILFHPRQYTRVARFERLKEDLELVLQETELKPLTKLVAYGQTHAQDRGKHTGASERIAQYYTEESADLVRRIYKGDFEDFGYSLDLSEVTSLPKQAVA